MAIKAQWGCCQEAALGMGDAYFPCNRPAVAVLNWRGRQEQAIRVCLSCLDHNVRNRGGVVLRYVENWADDEAQE